MTATASPVKLTISLTEVAKTALPASLEARLQSSPEEPTAKSLEADAARRAKLRNAYLEAVKDRAARETQRAVEAAARKTRLAATRKDKVQRKLEAATSHAAAKKEADEAEREARKARNKQLFEAFAASRNAAAAARLARQQELAQAEKTADAKHSRIVQAVVDKSSLAVKRAAQVVESRKAKEMAKVAEAAERLEAKLCRAALSRSSRQSKEASPVTSPKKTPPASRFRVLNEAKIASETLRRSLDASMAKAASNREATLQATVDRAAAETAKAARVVAAQHAKASGEDADLKASKASLYEKLLNAEVQRLTNLKQRAAILKPTVKGCVVHLPDEPPRKPIDAALALRLGATPTTLRDSAGRRHEGAAARRDALRAALVAKATAADERRAAGLARVAKARTDLAAKLTARDERAVADLVRGLTARVIRSALAKTRVRMAADARAAARAAQAAKNAAATAAVEAAHERAKGATRATAERGEAARRQAAFTAARTSQDAVRAAAAAKHAAKEFDATARRDALLASKVAVAKKLGKKLEPSSVA